MDDFYVENFQRLEHEDKERDEKYEDGLEYMDDEGNDVRELAAKAEARFDSIREESIVEKMMGEDFSKYFATDERHEKHVWDAKHQI